MVPINDIGPRQPTQSEGIRIILEYDHKIRYNNQRGNNYWSFHHWQPRSKRDHNERWRLQDNWVFIEELAYPPHNPQRRETLLRDNPINNIVHKDLLKPSTTCSIPPYSSKLLCGVRVFHNHKRGLDCIQSASDNLQHSWGLPIRRKWTNRKEHDRNGASNLLNIYRNATNQTSIQRQGYINIQGNRTMLHHPQIKIELDQTRCLQNVPGPKTVKLRRSQHLQDHQERGT